MNTQDRDRLDEAIDSEARRMVAGTLPPSAARAVLSTIEERERAIPGFRWRASAGAALATVTASVALIALLGTRKAVPDAPGWETPAASTVTAPVAAVPGAETRPFAMGRWDRPGPVRIAPVTVAPVTVQPVEIALVTVGAVKIEQVRIPRE